MQKYVFTNQNHKYTVTLVRATYRTNNRFAAEMVALNGRSIAMITVNINAPLSENKPNINFVDKNNLRNIEEFLIENEIAKPTGYYVKSGFCVYPEYEFDLTKFRERK